MKTALREKIKESLTSILPIALIILILALTLTPLDTGTFVLFLVGVFLLIFGMGLFTQGADQSLLVIGEKIGTKITESGKIWLVALVSLIIGIIVTVAEPDLQILARQVPAIENYLLIITVAVGVGIFLTVAMLRIVLHVRLSVLLIAFYVIAFLLSIFVPPSFRAVSFDSGGVTTGPMTVPFILSLGVGVASLRAGKEGHDDSFGLVSLASVGPIIAVLALGIIFRINDLDYPYESLPAVENTRGVLFAYGEGLVEYLREVSIAIAPIFAFFLLFQLISHSFHRRQIVRILMGFVYTFLGLALFLTGANVGFMPVGRKIGEALASVLGGWLLIPIGMLIGYFIVAAEPAVHVLNKQVERMSAGAITQRSMKGGLCAGVSVSIGLAMLRILTGIDLLWILIPGYFLALLLTFFSPPVFTGIAFDSGGVASGAMVSAFVLPLAIGACYALGGGDTSLIMTDAFGCVAFVALTPLITIQILGIFYKRKTGRIKRKFLAVEEKILTYEVD
ncbi:MAG: DUF1538 domain-containing protein [Clostridia bacterium]|nr:DUF1538 domain-containing protein [Clostridia bacterium]